MSFPFILSFLTEPSNSLDLIWLTIPKNAFAIFLFFLSSFISIGSLHLTLILSSQTWFYPFCSYNSISRDIYHLYPPPRSFLYAILNTQRVDSFFVIIVYGCTQKNIFFYYGNIIQSSSLSILIFLFLFILGFLKADSYNSNSYPFHRYNEIRIIVIMNFCFNFDLKWIWKIKRKFHIISKSNWNRIESF